MSTKMPDPIDYQKFRTERPFLYLMIWLILLTVFVGGSVVRDINAKLDRMQPCGQAEKGKLNDTR